jgi:hypothetical protein
MNIEGGEYDLLEYMIKNQLTEKFENIQVQFHENVFEGWEEKYNFIINNLNIDITFRRFKSITTYLHT